MASASPQGRQPVEKSAQAFRTISEVAEELDLPQHVLRFWETRFAQIRPMKRNGGRRLYRPGDVALLRGIRALLYDDGLTIKGVQKVLREKGVRSVAERGAAEAGQPPASQITPEEAARRLAALRQRLEEQMPPSREETAAARAGAGDDAETPAPGRRRPLSAAERARVAGSIDRLLSVLSRLERD